MKKFLENFTILSFAKFMALVLVLMATSNLVFAFASDPLVGLTWENIKASAMQWLVGVFMASLTVIIGYVANLVRYAITHAYDAVRTYIANTQILEVIADLKDFCLNETSTVEAMAKKALENDNKIDDKELNEIAQKIVSDATATWGEKKVTYLTKYRPMLKEWLTVKAKAIIQGMIDSFRARQSATNTPTAQ